MEAATALNLHLRNAFTVNDANLIYATEDLSSLVPKGDERRCPFNDCEYPDIPVLDSIDIYAKDVYKMLKESKQ